MAGSIHKYQTGKGETRYMVMLEVGESGKRKQKKKMGFKTKKEANAFLVESQSAIIKGSFIEPSKSSYKEFIVDWFENIKKKSIPRTADTHQILINKYILVHLEDVTLSKLNSMHIETFINRMHDKGYSPATIRKAFNIVNNSLDYAVDKGLVLKNVAKKATLPKDEKKEMHIWNEDQVRTFLKTIKNENYFMLFYMALQTGMRQGELLGLRWKDVDLENHTLSVKQVLSHDAKKFYNGAKTNAGNRTIQLSETIVSELKKHRAKTLQEKMLLGNDYVDYDLVICTPLGTQLNPPNIRRLFNRLIKEAEVPKIRFHDLRHTHATLLLSKGVNIKVISERLGHANIKITLDTYSHVLPTMQKEAVKKLDEVFGL
ncbi:site-specific integrase [Bacillus sp. CH30_1T]|uniref:tyrosine-type recombinase/integrase n=1 Tax=Bacillus sp. CH30_1T TaxID=2604836 RepID=UPI0011F06DF2|nr:site-specific integrase [Bacillus sp. CH30_1T]KAA0565315.1 site-specific integrase [Bacillus sp. CH30_1T]